MVLCEVSWCPKDIELALLGPIPHPIKTHVHGTGALLLDYAIVKDAVCCGVVHLHWCGRLCMAHFVKSSVNDDGFFAVKECGANFCFCCGGDDVFEYFSNVEFLGES
jgi:hypothetical protein